MRGATRSASALPFALLRCVFPRPGWQQDRRLLPPAGLITGPVGSWAGGDSGRPVCSAVRRYGMQCITTTHWRYRGRSWLRVYAQRAQSSSRSQRKVFAPSALMGLNDLADIHYPDTDHIRVVVHNLSTPPPGPGRGISGKLAAPAQCVGKRIKGNLYHPAMAPGRYSVSIFSRVGINQSKSM
jgi:hypothetical protein